MLKSPHQSGATVAVTRKVSKEAGKEQFSQKGNLALSRDPGLGSAGFHLPELSSERNFWGEEGTGQRREDGSTLHLPFLAL